MKKLYMGIFSALLMMIIIISTFQDLSARQNDPGQPCDPDAVVGVDPLACPIDSDIVFLLIGGIALYFVAKQKQAIIIKVNRD
ncbi:hypothetical protein ABIB40_003571 [Pedobacter sp. UYP30]|uniref:hypothetical protein n=1 Tax=Pedobacter sp. UYP30 TaxID=1756400 RepID=UPI00339A897A